MSTIKANRGVYDFRVICDTTNNTADVIDNNELILDVIIKPSRVIENITIRFVATRTDANFEELISGTG
jgi:phage tail sheath protein FI